MSILEVADKLLREEIAPRAQDIDRDPEVLRWALGEMTSRGLMAMRRPAEFGGPDVDEAGFRCFQETVARTSGSLSFLQTQHQSSVSLIAKGHNEELKKAYLPLMADGQKLVGIGFSQLRRPGPPIMRARPTEGGYVLDGHVPWVTGWSFYPEFLIAASLEDGSALFAIVPLVEGPGVHISEPMKLAAMESAQTVTVDFTDFFVPNSLVSAIQQPGWIQNNDLISVALQRHFALGCAQAGLDVLKAAGEKRGASFILEAYEKLSQELEACRDAVSSEPTDEAPTAARLNARAWAIELCARCAHAAVTASSGAANSLSHPAQRIYREALVYTVSAQTAPIMEATLNRLTR